MTKECWTMQEIYELVELLLSDKCEVIIRARPRNMTRSDTSWLVEWRPDRELCGGKQ